MKKILGVLLLISQVGLAEQKVISDADRKIIEARLAELARGDEAETVRRKLASNSIRLFNVMYAANKLGVTEYLGKTYLSAEFVVERNCLYGAGPAFAGGTLAFTKGKGPLKFWAAPFMFFGGLVSIACGATGALHTYAVFDPRVNPYLQMTAEELENELQKLIGIDQELQQQLVQLSSR